MNTKSHTVTVPIEDYTELLGYKEKAIQGEANLKEHLNLIYADANLLFLPDLSKKPTKINKQYDGTRDVTVYRFEY